MDDADRASALSELDREGALARQLRDGRAIPPPAGMAGVCRDCGGAIPLARRAAMPSACRCLDCQDAAERDSAGHPA